jgi:hypothetical protein
VREKKVKECVNRENVNKKATVRTQCKKKKYDKKMKREKKNKKRDKIKSFVLRFGFC